VVYVSGIDEYVMPVVIAVCPFGGCMRGTENVFTDKSVSRLRTLSFDFGVRATTLNRTDPRDKGGTAFLTGLSWNPIAFVRLSAGEYFFENTLTTNKNTGMYVGITLNVLEAAGVLGALGLTTPAAPVLVATGKTAP
jgi:hypothetical protein